VKPLLIIACIDMFLLIFVNIFYQVLYFPKLNQLGLSVQYLGFVDVATLICAAAALLVPLAMYMFSRSYAYSLIPATIIVALLLLFAKTQLPARSPA
jgi:hypothetical protein